MERIRWQIAELLNRLPGQCWTDLVKWAQYGREDGEPVLPLRPVDWMCRRDAEANGACWCGKVGRDE